MSYNAYYGLDRGQYSNADVYSDLQMVAGWRPPMPSSGIPVGGSAHPMHNAPSHYPGPGSGMPHQQQEPFVPHPSRPSPYGSFGPYYGNYASMQPDDDLIVKEIRREEPHYCGQRIVDQHSEFVRKNYVTVEKVVEVPQVMVKERTVSVQRPEIVERIIEVPKTEYIQHIVEVPQVITREEIKEVPYPVIEDRVVHVPKIEVQERIIEVPKIEFREVIEYEDRIEYREVPVDRIVEVPEIEYKIKEVEIPYPQPYFVEEIVEQWVPVPVVQVQEVERLEEVPDIRHRQVPKYRPIQLPTYRQVFDTMEPPKQVHYPSMMPNSATPPMPH